MHICSCLLLVIWRNSLHFDMGLKMCLVRCDTQLGSRRKMFSTHSLYMASKRLYYLWRHIQLNCVDRDCWQNGLAANSALPYILLKVLIKQVCVLADKMI